jgi:ketosteroid isomerase-like protein
MKSTLRIFLGLFMLGFGVMACKQNAMQSSAEEPLIREARAKSNEAIASHDAKAMAAFWTSDFHIITSRNSEMSGKNTNRERMESEFSGKPDVLYVRTPQTIQVFEAWSMASESGTWTGSWTENAQKIELTGTYMAKWHKVDGAWLIRAEVFVPLTCSGGAYCDKSPI